jgi:hypothetical protein
MSNSREPALAARLEAGAELQQPVRDVGGQLVAAATEADRQPPSASASAEASPRRPPLCPFWT